jgi:hypothetical protein
MDKTMLKKEDWGGLTIVALLSAYVFPPYFIYLMSVAALTEFAHLWTTRLSRLDQERFIVFEREFRKGYKLEKSGNTAEALRCYRKLEKKYKDLAQAQKIAVLQIRSLKNKTPAAARSHKVWPSKSKPGKR